MTDKIRLTEENLESISGGNEAEWDEVLSLVQSHVLKTDPDYFRDPHDPKPIESARWIYRNLPGFDGAAIGSGDLTDNDYFFTDKSPMKHAEFMEYLKNNLK